MKRYQYRGKPDAWFRDVPGFVLGSLFLPRVPPDTARRRLRRRDMETLEALVRTAKRMGKAVR